MILRQLIFNMSENQFVNPSWQLGTHYTTQERVCIVNDDIIFNIKRFHEFVLASNAKAICMTNWNRIDKDQPEWELVSNNSPNARPAGGGQLSVNSNIIPKKMGETFTQDTLEYYKKMHILGLSCSTIFPMELKMAWKYDDIDTKLKYEQKLNRIING